MRIFAVFGAIKSHLDNSDKKPAWNWVRARLSRHKILLASLGVRRETIMPISVQYVEKSEIANDTFERISVRRRGNCSGTRSGFSKWISDAPRCSFLVKLARSDICNHCHNSEVITLAAEFKAPARLAF